MEKHRHFMVGLASSFLTEPNMPLLEAGRVLSLVRESEATAHQDRAESLRKARLATVRSLRLPSGALANAVRAEAFGALANAQRVGNRLDGAQLSLRRAWGFHSQSRKPRALTARLEEWAASLCKDRREFDLALTCIDRALELRDGDSQAVGRDLVKKASIQIEAGDAQGARRTLAWAMDYVSGDPVLNRLLVHNLAWCHVDLGAIDRAVAILQDTEELPVPDFLTIQNRWLRARILAVTCPDLAEPELRAVMAAFLADKRPYDAALAGLELATIQPAAQALDTLALVQPTFLVLGIRREAVAARLLQEILTDKDRLPALLPQAKRALRSYSPGDFKNGAAG